MCIKCCPMGVTNFSCDQTALRTLMSLRPSVCLSHLPLYSSRRITMKLSGVIAIDKHDVRSEAQDQMSKVKVTEVKANFVTIWVFPDRNSSSYLQMVTKWCTKLDVAKKDVPYWFLRKSVKFQGHTGQKIADFDRNFSIITRLWINWQLWNDAQSLKWHKSGALLFFKVICQISWSHGIKNCRFFFIVVFFY